MTYALGKRSLDRLDGVHPRLVSVVKHAIELTAVDFLVVCGVRTVEEQIALYARGRTTAQMRKAGVYDVAGEPTEKVVTWTLNSQHFRQPKTGFGHAVDLAAFVAGKANWEPRNMGRIASAMKAAAAELSTPIDWGGDWTQYDGGHFQLPRGFSDE